MSKTIGILREVKNKVRKRIFIVLVIVLSVFLTVQFERRVPLIPSDVKTLVKKGYRVHA